MNGSAPSTAGTELDGLLLEQEESFGLDPATALRDAAAAETVGRTSGDVELELRGQALRADVWLRQPERTPEATKLLRAVEVRAAEHGLPLLQARSHRLLSRVAANMGDYAGQLDHALRGLELLPAQASARIRVMHLMALAEALARTRSAESAVRRYHEAEEVAMAAGDTLFCSFALNDLAYCLYSSGQPERAEVVMDRLIALLEREGRPPIPPILDTLVRIKLALGCTAEAVEVAKQLAAHDVDPKQYPDGPAEVALTLATAYHQAGELAEARATLDRALELSSSPELARIRADVLREQAELFATCGDFRAAFTTFKAYHQASEQLTSKEQEAQAKLRQTAFETAEARRDAERFREDSLRDPLTGLHNRRYIDVRLPALLTDATARGVPLVAAIVDIDHFKRINDSCSHAIGDQVLVTVAGLLLDAVSGGPDGCAGFAARLGGDEFLIVFTELALGAAVSRLEELCAAVVDQPWPILIGDLPVTLSVGVAAAGHPQRPADLLEMADRNLYSAKRRGRNCVGAYGDRVADPSDAAPDGVDGDGPVPGRHGFRPARPGSAVRRPDQRPDDDR